MPPPPPPPAPGKTHDDEDGPHVLLLGDSVTAAEGVRPEEGYPALAEAALRLQPGYARLRVHAQGRSGWSTGSYLRRWPEVEAALAALPGTPALLVVQLGANDLREYGHADATVAGAATRIAEVCDRAVTHYAAGRPAQQGGVRGVVPAVALASPPMVFPEALDARLRGAGFGPHTPRLVLALRDAYRGLAGRRGWGLLDLSVVLGDGQTLDGAHPSPAGHAALARHVAGEVARLLPTPAAGS